jgi:excisionase family DNA binding protein
MSEIFSEGLEAGQVEAYDDTFFEILMKIDEVARFLNVSEKTIRRLAIRGEIPTTRIGKSYRFIRSDIIRWAQSGGTSEIRR